ncbi:MAG: hypothetical protein ACE5MK_08460, partial [Acidobacteriota bacterium]
ERFPNQPVEHTTITQENANITYSKDELTIPHAGVTCRVSLRTSTKALNILFPLDITWKEIIIRSLSCILIPSQSNGQLMKTALDVRRSVGPVCAREIAWLAQNT